MRKSAFLLLTLFMAVGSHAQDSVSVLFIGNSYTYVNDLPAMTKLLSESMGKQLTVGSKTNGGYSFQNQCADPLTWNAIHEENWDVIVLQAQSQEPSFPDEQVNSGTLPFAAQLADSVYSINPCSNVLYYMTWGRETGDPQWEPISTFDGMNERLYNAYLRMADSTDGMVAAVGAVWKYVRDHHPAIQLYSGDGSHPSVAGTYLAACTFYTSLFLESVSGATYLAGLDAQTAGWLQAAADAVVLDSLVQFKVHAVAEPVQAHFTFSVNGNEVAFQNTSTRDDYRSWTFGDGGMSTQESPGHTYATTGSYNVYLVAGNACATDTAMISIDLLAAGTVEIDGAFVNVLEYNDHFPSKRSLNRYTMKSIR